MMASRAVVVIGFGLGLAGAARPAGPADWPRWIERLGHDNYTFPDWIQTAMRACKCSFAEQQPVALGEERARLAVRCTASGERVSWRADLRAAGPGGAGALSYCSSKLWLLEHMPAFDLHFLPGSIAVNVTSMLDDNVAFALMADRAAAWSSTIPLATKLSYLLPYASYHESRQNWRPLLFAKFFSLVATATSVREAMGRLVAPNAFTEWGAHYWPDSDVQPPGAHNGSAYKIVWGSSTAPPVLSPVEFVSYGYGSCSAWATMVTYVARAVGIAARQAGTPCWNSVYQGVDYRGLADANPNVSVCWSGGSDATGYGGDFLNNHNWVEYYLPSQAAASGGAEEEGWVFVNVPPATKQPDAGLCAYADGHGCDYNASAAAGHECDGVSGGPGAAMRDHEIYAITWSDPDDMTDEVESPPRGPTGAEGGPVLDVAGLRLTDGTPASPLVWSPRLASPMGLPLRDVGLRVVNRTEFYRCRPNGDAR